MVADRPVAGAAPFHAGGGAIGVLLLHGFSSVPGSLYGVAKALADAGYEVSVPLLPGHGSTLEALQSATWREWRECAVTHLEALRARCDRVAVVGHSMGGALAVSLATESDDVAALVVINPQLLLPVEVATEVRTSLERGVTLGPAIGGDVKKGGGKPPTMPHTPLVALHSLFLALPSVTAALSRLAVPGLLLSSREDHVVSPLNGDALMNAQPRFTRRWLEESYHVATLDNDADAINAYVLEFLSKEIIS
jgi:carboxylesterase